MLGTIGSLGLRGTSGKVTVVHTGDAFATDVNGVAALFQSSAVDDQQDITATLNGTFRGGSVLGKGVLIDGGKNNTLTVNGSVSAVSNLAIVGTTGNDTVDNNGVVVGNVQLDGSKATGTTVAGAPQQAAALVRYAAADTGYDVDRIAVAAPLERNVFNNAAGATFLSLDTIGLGAAGLLNNAGFLTPGGVGQLQTSNETGSFVQTSTGTFVTDLDLSPTQYAQFTDRLNATGTATIDGRVVTQVANVPVIQAGQRSSVVVQATGGITDSGVTLVAPVSAIARFGLAFAPMTLTLTEKIDFATPDRTLNRNQTAAGDYFNRIQNAGSSTALAPVITQLFDTPDAAALARIYDSYSGEIYADQLVSALYGADRFTHAMAGCADSGIAWHGSGCVWLSAGGQRFRQRATADNFDFRDTGGFVQAGIQHDLGASPLYAALAGSWESVNTHVDGANGEGDRYQGAVAFGYRAGRIDARIYGSYGKAAIDTIRPVLTPGQPSLAQLKQRFDFGQVGAKASYRFDLGAVDIRPGIEGGYAYDKQQRGVELGAGPVSLSLDQRNDGSAFVRPSLKASATIDAGGFRLKPSVEGAYMHRFERDVTTTAQFVGAPQDATSFPSYARLDGNTGQVDAGLTVSKGRVSLRLGYQGEYGARTKSKTATGKLTVAF